MATYLDRILSQHRIAANDDARSLDQLMEEISELSPCRGFRNAIAGCEGLGVISEIKRRSPSKGDLNIGLDPVQLASRYESGGATCLSVLTDSEFFGGSRDDLRAARSAVSIPVLRKDFTVSALDVADARIMGADAVLLIVAALDDHELRDFYGLAVEIDLDVLVETHDESEVERAQAVGADMIGVNQRDLVTFEVDTDRAVRIGKLLPDTVVRIAESGVSARSQAAHLFESGYDAVLVGESLVKAGDPAMAVSEMRSIGAGQ